MLRRIPTSALVFTLLLGCDLRPASRQQSVDKRVIEQAIADAVDFLAQSQLANGEFDTLACPDPAMSRCFSHGSPFVTTFVLYSLHRVQHPKVAPITRKGLAFLENEQVPGGLWKYFTARTPLEAEPDLDDTANAAFALKRHGITFDDNLDAIEANRTSQGLYYTWVGGADNQHNIVDGIDCVVNTNVLLYLGKSIPEVCRYLNRAIEREEDCGVYYSDWVTIYYMVARALANGVTCLGEHKDLMIKRLVDRQRPDGSFGGVLDSALALAALSSLGYRGERRDATVKYILATQGEDGSWPMEMFYKGPTHFYGAQALTTAICVEALNATLETASDPL